MAMRIGPVLSEAQGRAMFDELKAKFGFTATMKWNPKRTGGVFHWSNIVEVGLNGFPGMAEDTILHESAHAIVWERFSKSCRPNGQGPHGDTFRNILLELITAWYGDPKLYSWRLEYKGVMKWGQKQGFM